MFRLELHNYYTMLKKWKANIGKNITELKADNLKKGKEKWAGGKVRPMKQIIAIALNTAWVKPKEGSKKEQKWDKGKEMKIEKKEYKKSKK